MPAVKTTDDVNTLARKLHECAKAAVSTLDPWDSLKETGRDKYRAMARVMLQDPPVELYRAYVLKRGGQGT